jgi:hypothetical protein
MNDYRGDTGEINDSTDVEGHLNEVLNYIESDIGEIISLLSNDELSEAKQMLDKLALLLY